MMLVTESRPGPARILIVDDEPAVRRFAARALLEEGYLVEEAGDGAAALALVQAAVRVVHAVVSDVAMPRLNGVELLRALAISRPQLPVILMSGYATTQLAAMGIAAPCGILAKPFPAERLVEEVRRCLRDADPLALFGSNGADG
jgi:DNA-binding NtrC family response regulator